MAWRAQGGTSPAGASECSTPETDSAIVKVSTHLDRLRHHLGTDWEPLAHLVEDASQSRHVGRLQVAGEAVGQWRQERELDARRAGWSESLVTLQDNADRLARERILIELQTSRSSVIWEALARLIDDALHREDVAKLRVASIASTIWRENWWEWWEDPARLILAMLRRADV